MRRIVFCVTNDLVTDQRMQRICRTLASDHGQTTLVGRKLKSSLPLTEEPFEQDRLQCLFNKGPLFYLEFNIRLFVYLLFKRVDIICAIDLDTILPCLLVSMLRQKHRVYDAHEYFTEQKEVLERQTIFRVWSMIEAFAVPKFPGYTVNQHLANLYQEKYGINYEIIRNISFKYILQKFDNQLVDKYLLYQGAVNHGRCFEQLIPAMKEIDIPLKIVGNGNFFDEVIGMVRRYGFDKKVVFLGTVTPLELRPITQQAFIGLTLFEAKGANQYYSLANRFFDYMMAGIPQVCVNYPEYAAINEKYGFAYLIDAPTETNIAAAVNKLASDPVLYQQLKQNCLIAREELNWQKESVKLLAFYNRFDS